MNEVRERCKRCGGTGHRSWWVLSDKQPQKKSSICEECNGLGYMEYIVSEPSISFKFVVHINLPKLNCNNIIVSGGV